jgi:hypothetical protein
MTDNTIEQFFTSELRKIEAEQQQRAQDHGYAEFYTAPVGETAMTVKYQVPRDIETQYGPRKVFRIIVDEMEYDFSVNTQAPLYRYLIHSLAETKKDVDFVLVRTGTGKATKYDIKEV